MKSKNVIKIAMLSILMMATVIGFQNCGEFQKKGSNSTPTSRQPADDGSGDDGGVVEEVVYRQIERLGRPAVNEGLVLTNSKLNAFNSIPPTLDLAVDNPAVLSVLQEASAVLDLVDTLDGVNNFGDGFDSEVVAGFLPDVMRLDTSVSIPPGTAAYNGDAVTVEGTSAAMLTGGRKIEDDVVDITLSYLVAGDASGATIQDNVSYEGAVGNASQGHKMLHGQAAYGGAASFPFLATPH